MLRCACPADWWRSGLATGWLAASSEGASVNFFGVVSIRHWDLGSNPAPIAAAQNAEVRAKATGGEGEEFFEEVHEVLGNALLILASLHALAALKHHFLDRDDVLKRMLPAPKRTTQPRVAR
jgi:cytochrome b561